MMRSRSRGPLLPFIAAALLGALAVLWITGPIGQAGLSHPVDATSVWTTVTLTWDYATISHYTLASQRAMQPHSVQGTFFIHSGHVPAGPAFSTRGAVRAPAAHGDA